MSIERRLYTQHNVIQHTDISIITCRIMTLSIMKCSITTINHDTQRNGTPYIVFMLNLTNIHFMLSVVVLNVIMLGVVMLNVGAPVEMFG
jgi:hypothetical protein